MDTIGMIGVSLLGSAITPGTAIIDSDSRYNQLLCFRESMTKVHRFEIHVSSSPATFGRRSSTRERRLRGFMSGQTYLPLNFCLKQAWRSTGNSYGTRQPDKPKKFGSGPPETMLN
jgi:hypothetical protein